MPAGEDPTVYNTPDDPKEAKREARALLERLGLDPVEFEGLLEKSIRARKLPTRSEFNGLIESLTGEGTLGASEFRYRFVLSGHGVGVVSLLRPVDAAVDARWDRMPTSEKRAYFERVVGDRPARIAEHFTPDTVRFPWLSKQLVVDSKESWRLQSTELTSVSEAEAKLREATRLAGRSAQTVELTVRDTKPQWERLEGKSVLVEGFFQRASNWVRARRIETLRPGRTLDLSPRVSNPAQIRITQLNRNRTSNHLEVKISDRSAAIEDISTLAKVVTHQLRAHTWGDFSNVVVERLSPERSSPTRLLEHYGRYLTEVEGTTLTPERRRIVEGLERGTLGNSAEAVGAPLLPWANEAGLPETTRRAVRFAQEGYLSWLHHQVQLIESGAYGVNPSLAVEETLREVLGLTRAEATAIVTARAGKAGVVSQSELMRHVAATSLLSAEDQAKLSRLTGVDLSQLDAEGLQERLGITAKQAQEVLLLRDAQTLELALELAEVSPERREELRKRAKGLDLGSSKASARAIADYMGIGLGLARQIVAYRESGWTGDRNALREAGFSPRDRAELKRISRLNIGPNWTVDELRTRTGLGPKYAQLLIDARTPHRFLSLADAYGQAGLVGRVPPESVSRLTPQELNSLNALELSQRANLPLVDAEVLTGFRDVLDITRPEVLRTLIPAHAVESVLRAFNAVDVQFATREQLLEKGLEAELVERVLRFRDAHPLGRLTPEGAYDAKLAADALLEAKLISPQQVEAVLKTQALNLEQASVAELRQLGLSERQAKRVVRLRDARELSVAALVERGFDPRTAKAIAEALQPLSLGANLDRIVRRTGISQAGQKALRKLQAIDFSNLEPNALRAAGLNEAQVARLLAVSNLLAKAPLQQGRLRTEIGRRVKAWFAESGLSDGFLRSLLPRTPAESNTKPVVTEPSRTKPSARTSNGAETSAKATTEGRAGGKASLEPRPRTESAPKAESPPKAEATAVDKLAAWRKANGRVDWKRFAGEKTRVEAAGLAHFGLALFLKELAVAVKSGDRLYVEEFFDALLTTDFYTEYGLFVAGARLGEAAYTRYLQKHVKRKFVNSVLKTNLVLATGLALPAIVHGRLEGKAFAISLGSLGLSSALVHGGTRGIKWVVDLRKARAVGGAARTGLALKRLTKAGAWLYSAAELAVILYVAEEFEHAVNGFLDRESAKKAIGNAGATFLRAVQDSDATPESVTAAAEAYDVAWTTYRDFLYSPMFATEAQVAQRMEGLAETAKELDDKRKEALKRVREHRQLKLKIEADHGGVVNYSRHLVERDERALQKKLNQILESYERERREQLREVYDGNRRSGDYLTSAVTADSIRNATGSAAWAWRMQLRFRVSPNRLQAYADELEVFALGSELLAGQPKLRAALETYAERVSATEKADDQLAHGDSGVVDTAAAKAGISDQLQTR